MSSFKRSLIGLVILALIGGYYYFYEVKYQGKKAKQKEIREKIFPVESLQSVSKIVYKKGKSAIVLEKKGSLWKMTSPVKTDVDDNTVNTFLKTFIGLKSFRKLPDVKWDNPDFGLKKTPLHVTLYDKEGKSFTATFGNSNPTKSYYYTLKGKDKTVLLVWIYPKKLLNETLYDFRFKKVCRLDSGRVVKVHFEKGLRRIDLQRVKGHTWKIVSPIEAKGDRYAIEGFISTATDEKVIRFLDNPPQKPEEFGWDHPRMKIVMAWSKAQTKGKEKKAASEKEGRTVILVGKDRDAQHIYVKVAGRPSVLVVKKGYLKELDKKVFDFRDKNVWNYEVDDVTRVKYENKKQHLVIEAKKGSEDEWNLSKPEKMKADSRAVENWLWDLSGFRVKKFLDKDAFAKKVGASASPELLFTLNVKGDKKPLTLKLFHVEGQWIAQGDEPGWYYLLDAKDVQKVFKTVFDLKYRRIVTFEDTNVAKVEVRTAKKSYRFMKKKNLWYREIGEKKKKVPNIDVLNFLWELSDLKYTKLSKKLPKEGSLNPPVHVALTDADGKSLGDLTFYSTKDGLAYVFMVKGKKQAYWIDKAKMKKFEDAYKKLTKKQEEKGK